MENNTTLSFSSREKPQFLPDFEFNKLVEKVISKSDDNKVKVLRYLTFCYVTQETTLGHLRKLYTEKAITTMEEDGYIKIY